MIYVNDSVPSSFHYLVSASDNYVVLTDDSSVSADYMTPDTIDVYYCYFSPSFQTFRTTQTFTYSTRFTNINNSITNNLYYAKDFPIIIITSLILCFLTCLLYNGITRLIRPHGIMF